MDQANNIFLTQTPAQTVLSPSPGPVNPLGLINGISPNSLQFTSGLNKLTARDLQEQLAKGGIKSISLESITANIIQGGTLKIGNSFSVSNDGSMIASAGKIGGWTINTGSIVSPNGNIVIDATDNRILIYNSNVPQILIQG